MLGAVREQISDRGEYPGVTTHSLNPQQLLTLARERYQTIPERAFLLTIGGASFKHGDQISAAVRRLIPAACNQIKALLSGVSLPLSETLPQVIHRQKSDP